jgi:hypothetical protein
MEKVIIHNNYTLSRLENNIAIVKFSKSIVENDGSVKPICLWGANPKEDESIFKDAASVIISQNQSFSVLVFHKRILPPKYSCVLTIHLTLQVLANDRKMDTTNSDIVDSAYRLKKLEECRNLIDSSYHKYFTNESLCAVLAS